ncbi:MAG: hypothetical protein KA004_05155 [Verrucomicrobiales bacterium]|nr:hypothetical protein [Verrucomicrobiales bacterium]
MSSLFPLQVTDHGLLSPSGDPPSNIHDPVGRSGQFRYDADKGIRWHRMDGDSNKQSFKLDFSQFLTAGEFNQDVHCYEEPSHQWTFDLTNAHATVDGVHFDNGTQLLDIDSNVIGGPYTGTESILEVLGVLLPEYSLEIIASGPSYTLLITGRQGLYPWTGSTWLVTIADDALDENIPDVVLETGLPVTSEINAKLGTVEGEATTSYHHDGMVTIVQKVGDPVVASPQAGATPLLAFVGFINGTVVSDMIRGYPLPLWVDDAAPSTQISSGLISDNRLFPLRPTSFAGPYDDDFTGADLDPKWTRHGLVAGDHTYQTGGGSWTSMNIPAGTVGAGTVRSISQSWTPTDTNISCRLAYQQVGGPYQMMGPFITDSSGNGIGLTVYNNGLMLAFANLSGWSFNSFRLTATTSLPPYNIATPSTGIWLKLRKSGTTYYGSASYDGLFWGPEISVVIATTMTDVGMGLFSRAANGTDYGAKMHFDFFKVH